MKWLLSSGIAILTVLSIMGGWSGMSDATASFIPGKSIVAQSTHEQGKAKENDLTILIDKGNQAFTLKKYDEAIGHYKKALVLDPGSAEVHYNLGMTYANLWKPDEAIAEYKKALDITPDDPEIHNNLGAVYLNKGMLAEALTECQKALSLNPDLPAAIYNLGIINERKGQKALAADSFYKAGLLYLKQGEREWVLKAINSIKSAHATQLAEDLLEKLNAAAGPKQ